MSYTPLSFSPVPRSNPQEDYSFANDNYHNHNNSGNNNNNHVTLSNYNNMNTANTLKQTFEEMRQERKNNNINNNNQVQNDQQQQRALSPIRERANMTTDAFSSTLADIDRRTLRSQSYLSKKLENTVENQQRNNNNNNKEQHQHSTRFHRVARDVPSYDANQTFSYYATHNEHGTTSPGGQQNNNNNNNTQPLKYFHQQQQQNSNSVISGLKLKEIQEEITRRRLQSEKAIIAAAAASPPHPYEVSPSTTKNNNSNNNTKAVVLPPVSASSPSTNNNNNVRPQSPHRYQSIDEEQSSALKKRLEESRRSTEQSFKVIFAAAFNSLVRRENEERLPITTEQTQQFARLTAHKALQYANVINSPQTRASPNKKNLPNKTNNIPSAQPQGGESTGEAKQDEEPPASELQKFLQMSGYKSSPQKQEQEHNNNNNNNSKNDITNPTIVEIADEHNTAARRRDLPVSERSVQHQNNNYNNNNNNNSDNIRYRDEKTPAPFPSQTHSSYESETPSQQVIYVEDTRTKTDNACLRQLFVQETLMKSEIVSREEIVNDAFDQSLNIALRMSVEKPQLVQIKSFSPATNIATPQFDDDSVFSKQDKDVLTSMFVAETLSRREFEIRQGIMSEAFDSTLTIIATFVNLSPNKSNINNENKRQTTQKGGARSSSSSASPCSATAITTKSELEVQKMAQRFKDDKNVLRDMYIVENVQYREAQTRVGLLLEALNETAAAFGSVAAAATASPFSLQQQEKSSITASPKVNSSNNNNNKNAKTVSADMAVLRSLYVGENLEHREARRRQEILLEALIEYSYIVNAVTNSAVASSAKNNNNNNSNNINTQQKSRQLSPQQQQDQGLLKSLFVVENMEHRECQGRQKLLLEALTQTFLLFQNFKPTSSSSSAPSADKKSKIVEVPKAAASSSPAPANAAELHATIMLETVALRESEQRNSIESDCWRSYLELHQFHDVFLVKNLTEHEKKWTFENNNHNNNNKGNDGKAFERVQKDLAFVKTLFVFENLQRRETEVRSGIAQEAFLFNVSSFGWRVPFDLAAYSTPSRNRETEPNKNNNTNNNVLSERAKRDIAVLRSSVLEEHCFRREVDARAKVQEQALLELMPIIRAFDQKNAGNNLVSISFSSASPSTVRSRPPSASATAENSHLLRSMFIHENLFHRELGNRSTLCDTESAERLQLIISFYASALAISNRIAGQNNNNQASLPPRPASAAMFNKSAASGRLSRPSSAQQDAKFLREMYVIENFTKKESESRHNLEQDQFMNRLEFATLASQELILASPNNRNATAREKSSSSSPNAKQQQQPLSPAFAAERKLLREMFIVENLEHRESNARSTIVEDSLRSLMLIVLARNGSSNSSSSPSVPVSAPSKSSINSEQQQENSKVITQLQFFREESRARTNILNEESQGAIDLAIRSRPLKQVIKGRLRALQDISVLRQMFLSEQFARKEAEVRADLALQASMGGASAFAQILASSASSPVKKQPAVQKPQQDEDNDEL